jgi:hypothetical protein
VIAVRDCGVPALLAVGVVVRLGRRVYPLQSALVVMVAVAVMQGEPDGEGEQSDNGEDQQPPAVGRLAEHLLYLDRTVRTPCRHVHVQQRGHYRGGQSRDERDQDQREHQPPPQPHDAPNR